MKVKNKSKKIKKSIQKTSKKKISVKKISKEKLKKLGNITHYFDRIKVAVIKLSLPAKIGDKIRIIGGENTDFRQQIKSMQINHEKAKSAKKGKSIGLKVKEKVREGYKVYKI